MDRKLALAIALGALIPMAFDPTIKDPKWRQAFDKLHSEYKVITSEAD